MNRQHFLSRISALVPKDIQRNYQLLSQLPSYLREKFIQALQLGLTVEDILETGTEQLPRLISQKIKDHTSENLA